MVKIKLDRTSSFLSTNQFTEKNRIM